MLAIIGGVLMVDQLTKFLAIVYLQPRRSIPVFGDFLRLTYVENPGMAFGIELENKFLFNLLSLLAVGLILVYLFKLRDHVLLRTAFAVILGGAFGNLLDRFLYGRVVDFVDVEFFDLHFSGGTLLFWNLPEYSLYRWPVFNMADVAVTVGMLLVIWSAFFYNPSRVAVEHAVREEI